jgi:GTP-binding protein HflX
VRVALRFPDAVLVSALTGHGLPDLLELVEARLPVPPLEVKLLVPYDRQDVTARLHRETDIRSSKETEQGTELEVRLDEAQLAWARDFLSEPLRRELNLPG